MLDLDPAQIKDPVLPIINNITYLLTEALLPMS